MWTEHCFQKSESVIESLGKGVMKMVFETEVILKNGKVCLLRSAGKADAREMIKVFNQTHAETENLLTYPDENSFTVEKEEEFLENIKNSENAVEIAAFVDGVMVGTAGISPIGENDKVKHRADFGISILKAYWGLGIGTQLLDACILSARRAGYRQVELEAVADNEQALLLYKKAGFTEFGRNPRGFKTRSGKWQTVVLMLLDLEDTDEGTCIPSIL